MIFFSTRQSGSGFEDVMGGTLQRMESFYWAYKSPIERMVVISWLLKDLAWMATIVWQGMIFGVISILLHGYFLVADARVAMRFHHTSMLCWVTGNFFWMILEFYCTVPSSGVHIGLSTPVGGITEHYQYVLIHTKHWLFMTAVIMQAIVYSGFFFGFIAIPTDEEEEELRKKNKPVTSSAASTTRHQQQQEEGKETSHDEVTIDLSNRHVALSQMGDGPDSASDGHDSPHQPAVITGEDSVSNANERLFGAPMVVCEYLYLWPWVLKDLFWSWATGDFGDLKLFTEVTSESLAIIFGCSAMAAFTYVGVLYRHNLENFLDSVTSVCWVAANLTWMCGEFFIRYDNMELDDQTEQNDTITRIFSTMFFLIGLGIQFCIVMYYFSEYVQTQVSVSHAPKRVNARKQYVELVNMSGLDAGGPRVPSGISLTEENNSEAPNHTTGDDHRNIHTVVTNAMHV